MYEYGFELEGFLVDSHHPTQILLPPTKFPVDDNKILVEARTQEGGSLQEQLLSLNQEVTRINNFLCADTSSKVDFSLFKAIVPAELKLTARRGGAFKEAVDIRNIYGFKPRNTGNYVLASFQINLSRIISRSSILDVKDKKGRFVQKVIMPPRYAQIDPGVIVRLDKEFRKEIKDSGRQPGFYAIKGAYSHILEYRSLPNTVFEPKELKQLADRIQLAVN